MASCALRQLQQRLCPLGLDVVEPPGQDGRTCQYLAIIHQLELHGVVNHFVAAQLEQRMIDWLLQHQSDVTGIHAARGDEADVSLLSDCWTEQDFHSLLARRAWGDHFTLASPPQLLQPPPPSPPPSPAHEPPTSATEDLSAATEDPSAARVTRRERCGICLEDVSGESGDYTRDEGWGQPACV